MRREPSERSEMVSQVLFGEVFNILDEQEKWVYIRLLHDGYEGWIDRKMYAPINAEYLEKYNQEAQFLTTEIFNIVKKEGDYGNKLIVSGSVLPLFNGSDKSMYIGEDRYILETELKEIGVSSLRNLLIEYALMYHNTPYLWGGRSHYGIDCSGLSQIVYRMAGIDIPRDASQQVLQGDAYSFLEEALPGDLAFFGDDAGAITHVGILWKENRIIHASGRVRVDKVDHQGIFNEDLKRYTHNLKAIKRIIEG